MTFDLQVPSFMVAHSFQQKHIGLVLQGADVWPGSPSLSSPTTFYITARFQEPKAASFHRPLMNTVKFSPEQKYQDLLSILRFHHWNLSQAKLHKSVHIWKNVKTCANTFVKSGNEAKFNCTGRKLHLV